jgi:hypothetical protein
MAVTFSARFFEAYAVLNANVVQAGILLKARGAASGSARALSTSPPAQLPPTLPQGQGQS